MFAFIVPLEVEAQPQPVFVAYSVITSAASPGGDMTVALPVGYVAYDIFILNCMIRSNTETVTVSGWNSVTGSPFDRGTSTRYWLFWYRATSASETPPLWDTDGSVADEFCWIVAYRNAASTGTPVIAGTASTGTSDPATITALSISNANALVVVPVIGEDNNNVAITTTGTNPVAYVEHILNSATGADAVMTISEETRTTAGSTGTVSVNWDVANPVGWGGMVLELIPVTGGANGHNSLITATSESPGANCANGGYKFQWGIDDGSGGGTADDGILQAGEVDGTAYVCNGATGAQGPQGPQGDPGANGLNSLVKISPAAPILVCPNGGITVESGLDLNANGVLDVLEVQYTAYVCNGAPGADGQDGYNALVNLTDADPANCTYGGQRIDAGQDIDLNLYLDMGEIMYTSFACNGAPGPEGPQGPQGENGTDGAPGPAGPLDQNILVVIGIILMFLMGLAALAESTVFMLAAGVLGIFYALFAVALGLSIPWFLAFLVAGIMCAICSPLGD